MIADRIGGTNHKFTGLEKTESRRNRIFAQVMATFPIPNGKTEQFEHWIPLQYLEPHEVELHNAAKVERNQNG